uniref:glutathione transferase n=1 Tax=Nautilus pompilius TaxID=34573 RepID=A0A0H5ANL7_9MOLL|nr:glutathione S-transferase 1 [Nautilus pompilius]
MPTYKLTYFDGKGRAELTRLLFTAAGVDFHDCRIGYVDDWPALKPHTPFGQLPILEIDDNIVIPQSLAIARHIARKYGYAGKDLMEQTQADVIVDTFDDLHVEFGKTLYEKDESKKNELKRQFREEVLPRYLRNLEKALKKNCGGEGYFVGNSLTWADLQAINILDITMSDFPDMLKDFPKLGSHRQRVENQPRIYEYLRNRPLQKL